MRITLVGFGLLASSIAAAVKQAKLALTIRAVSSKQTLEKAKELQLADEFFEYGEDWLNDSDLVFLCSPIKHIISTINKISSLKMPEKQIVITDIGSTKEEICKAGFALPAQFIFVGGHPMAGSEKRGVEHNDPSIFENAYWLYCTKEEQEMPKILADLLLFLGARLVSISPEEHDYAMAWLSHAPQLLSTSIAAGISEDVAEKSLHLAGRGFRDMTRIAASSWGMWKDILQTNKMNVVYALNGYSKKALEIKDELNAELFGELEDNFLHGNETLHHLATGKNYAYPVFEIIAKIPDEPGSILKALNPLAEKNINLRDIELMKVREGIGGTLLLAFKSESEAAAAVKILEENGIHAASR